MPPLRPPALLQNGPVRDHPKDGLAAPGDVVPDRPQARRPQDLYGLGVDPGLTALRWPHPGEPTRRLHMESLEGAKIEGGDDPGLAAVEENGSDDCLVEHPRHAGGDLFLGDDDGESSPRRPTPLEVAADGGGVAGEQCVMFLD